MLQKGKRGLAKHSKKSTQSGFSMHFKDLNDDDEDEPCPQTDAEELTTSKHEKLQNMKISDSPVTSTLVSNASAEPHLDTEIAETPKPLSPPNAIKVDNSASPLSHSKNVIEHPLMMTEASSDDEFDQLEPKKSRPAIPPPRPPPPKVQEKETQEKTVPRSTISSVLFDPKTRTQFISSLKKNVYQYTHSGSPTTANEEGIKSDYSFTQSSKSETIKGFKERALEPLNIVKKSLEDTAKESEDPTALRQRSSSENNIYGSQSKLLSVEEGESKDAESPASKSLRRRSPSTNAVSLSGLLADRQDSLDEEAVPSHSEESLDDHSVGDRDSKQDSGMPASMPVDSYESVPRILKRSRAEDANESSLSAISLYILAVPVYLFNILPVPFAIQIAVIFFFVGAICATALLWLFVSPRKPVTASKPPSNTHNIPQQIPKSILNVDKAYKGWMNEIESYDIETYHIAATTSVFVTLERNTLRLQTPKRNIPRRAMYGERMVQITNVINSRLFNLKDAKVYLIPYDLVKKRVWSKKYPICIEFFESDDGHNADSEKSKDSEHNADHEERKSKSKIFLFGRTQPQKERWFYRFQRAITIAQQQASKVGSNSTEKDFNARSDILEEHDDEFEILDDKTVGTVDPIRMFKNYYVYMQRLLPDPTIYLKDPPNPRPSKPAIDLDQAMIQFSTLANDDALPDVVTSQPVPITKSFNDSEPTLDVAWFNVVVGRIMFDFLRLQKWADWVAAKIQKKLEKIRLPYFMEGLKLTAMDLGKTVPLVHKISLPRMDAQGIWIDMDITYNGSVQMTLETKLVLTRLGKKENENPSLERSSAAVNSEEEDSAESSEDDESMFVNALPHFVQQVVPRGSENVTVSKSKGSSRGSPNPKKTNQATANQEKKWVRIMDSITKSKYFQKVTENAYIKKKLETVSNTPLILTAELNHCNGTISINIPPPPSDRIWYGFKEHPEMTLKAKPKFGERAVTVAPITDWIEKKLVQEFNKLLLIPNMDDIPIPLMFNNLQKQS